MRSSLKEECAAWSSRSGLLWIGLMVVWLGSAITYGLWARQDDLLLQIIGVLGSLVTFLTGMGFIFCLNLIANLASELNRKNVDN